MKDVLTNEINKIINFLNKQENVDISFEILTQKFVTNYLFTDQTPTNNIEIIQQIQKKIKYTQRNIHKEKVKQENVPLNLIYLRLRFLGSSSVPLGSDQNAYEPIEVTLEGIIKGLSSLVYVKSEL